MTIPLGQTNRQWRFAKRPKLGDPVSRDLFRLETGDVPQIGPDQMIVRTICLATSPAQWGYLVHDNGMFQPLAIGDVMRGRGVGEVIQSRHADFKTGDIVTASLGWQDYSLQDPTKQPPNIKTILKVENPCRPLTLALGSLGVDGFAAYFGLLDIGKPQAGETVVISAAAGGIGSVAGQIAKIKDCRVIGIAGSDEKCRWLTTDLGFDGTINYKTENVGERLDMLCPDGMDVFFDNVGGDILNDALAHLALKARVVFCGYISTEYQPGIVPGPRNYTKLLSQRARLEGFIVFDYVDRFPEAEQQMRRWLIAGRLKNTEDVVEGLDAMPDALASLFTGGNKGNKIVRVAPDPNGLPSLR